RGWLPRLVHRPPRPTLFPCTALFRSWRRCRAACPWGLSVDTGCVTVAILSCLAARGGGARKRRILGARPVCGNRAGGADSISLRSAEHTSELQSRDSLVCRLRRALRT